MTNGQLTEQLSIVIAVSEHAENALPVIESYVNEVERVAPNYEAIIALNADYNALASSLIKAYEDNPRVQVLQFSRNYGEGTLLQACFDQCTGDWVLVLPPYKQVEAEELSKLIAQRNESDIILGRRWPRVDSGVKRQFTKVFSGLANKLTDQNYSDPGCHVKLLSRAAAKELKLYGEQHRFLHLLAYEQGYLSTEVDLKQAAEDKRRSSPGPGLFVRRLLDLITIVFLTKFNKKPLRFFGMLGTSSIAFGFIGLLYLAYERIFLEIGMADSPLLVLFSIFFVLGIQLIGIGLIGETVIFTHAGKKKEYRIRKIFSNS